MKKLLFLLTLIASGPLQAQDLIILSDQTAQTEYDDEQVEIFQDQQPEKAGKDHFEPEHFLILGTGMGFANRDLNTNSAQCGIKAKAGYNGEILYGFYLHPNFGIDIRAGVGFLNADLEHTFEQECSLPGIWTTWTTPEFDRSSFKTFYLTWGPTARWPLKPFDIHFGIHAGILTLGEPTVNGNGRVQYFHPPGLSHSYMATNVPNYSTTLTYGASWAINFTLQDFLILRAEVSSHNFNLSYDETITFEIHDEINDEPHPYQGYKHTHRRDLSALIVQVRIGIGLKF